MRILVRRIGALGDAVLATPVLRRLRRENPDAEIGFQTAYPDVVRDSPHRIVPLAPGPLPYPWTPEGGVDRTIELTNAYETRPAMHIVEAYMEETFGDPGDPRDRQQELAYHEPKTWPKGRVVAVHAARAGWRNRTLPEATWWKVIRGLRDCGFFPVLVGAPRDSLGGSIAVVSFHVTDILAQAGFISRCVAFVGSDSGLLHVAGATDAPIVGVFTSAAAIFRMPLRGRKLVLSGIPSGGKFVAVAPDLPCVGCLHRRPPPVTTEFCERGDTACVGAVRAESIVEAVVRLVR